jgi:hypothetical protein
MTALHFPGESLINIIAIVSQALAIAEFLGVTRFLARLS